MKRNFDFKDVRTLIKNIETNYEQIKIASQIPFDYKEDIKEKIIRFGEKKTFTGNISNFVNGKNDLVNVDKMKDVISLLDKYQATRELALSLVRYTQDNDKYISGQLEAINRGSNGVKWLFSNKDTKEEVNKTYEQLSNLSNDPSFINNLTISKRILDIDKSNQLDKLDNEEYKALLLEVASKILTKAKLESRVDSLVNKYNQFITNVGKVDALLEEQKHIVTGAVEELLYVAAIKTLKNVPIDKINENKDGFKIKLLKEKGINTIYDLLKKDKTYFNDMPYFGPQKTKKMFAIANSFARNAKINARISLSVDDVSPESTAVIKATYTYLVLQAYKKNIKDIFKGNDSKINKSLTNVRTYGNGILWQFTNSEDRNNFKNDILFLQEYIASEDTKKINQVVIEATRIKSVDKKVAWKDFASRSITYINAIEDICPNAVGQGKNAVYGLPNFLAKEIAEEEIYDEGLNCSLRSYQIWGTKYILHQKRVLLGDEMGLGKTVQAIASIVSLRNQGHTHFLVVCPASVLTNWYREVLKHSDLNPIKIHGRDGDNYVKIWEKDGGVAITTYESTKAIKMEYVNEIDMMIVDEAHYVKNPDALRTNQVKRLLSYSERVLFMTGTALENRVDEMVTLIDMLRPDLSTDIRNLTFMSDAPEFRNRIAPVYYRRKREDVLTELPKLIETEEWCELLPEEERKYAQDVMSSNFMAARRLSWNMDDLSKSSKANRLLELVEKAKDDNRKVIVFSYFLDTLEKISKLLHGSVMNTITGSIAPQKRQAIIDEFDKAPAGTVLPAQIISGGVGLTIQSASVVIICEPHFKPSIENQAISRA